MARRPRLNVPGYPLHIVQRGVNRAACFLGDGDRALYLAILEEVGSLSTCDIHAYVLMTNHVHLLLSPVAAGNASLLMKHVNQRYAQAFNRKHARSGSLWEGRFRSCVIDSERYLLRCQRYIEMNPVRAGIVPRPRDYPWSSHRVNIGEAQSSLITPHALHRALGCDDAERITRYRELFEADVAEQEVAKIRRAINTGAPLGEAAFVQRCDTHPRFPPGGNRGQTRV